MPDRGVVLISVIKWIVDILRLHFPGNATTVEISSTPVKNEQLITQERLQWYLETPAYLSTWRYRE